MRSRLIAFELLKLASVGKDISKGLYAAGKGFLTSGKHISEAMAKGGVKSPVAHLTAKAAPAAVAAYGVKKGYESEPVQRLRYKIHEYKQRKAMEKAMRSQYGG
jgi:hypothetical protein